jgi:hypothetical protein
VKIFGRDTSLSHGEIALACAEMLNAPEDAAERDRVLNDRALAWNLIHDIRVNEPWAESWNRKYGPVYSPGTLADALNAYSLALRTRFVGCYADIEAQACNFVSKTSPSCPAGSDALVTVVDLWSPQTVPVWRIGALDEIGVLAGRKSVDFDRPRPPQWFADILSTGRKDSQEPLMSAFFLSLASLLERAEKRTRDATVGPFWVTPWEEWRKRVNESADDWCASVGLSKNVKRTPAWIAVIRYPARRVPRLICPTQLEAGGFGRHFPTSPDCYRTRSGRVIDGRPETRTPLVEYIHAPVKLVLDDWKAAGFPVLPTTGIAGDPFHLKEDRSRHWESLQGDFPDVRGWMDRPNY